MTNMPTLPRVVSMMLVYMIMQSGCTVPSESCVPAPYQYSDTKAPLLDGQIVGPDLQVPISGWSWSEGQSWDDTPELVNHTDSGPLVALLREVEVDDGVGDREIDVRLDWDGTVALLVPEEPLEEGSYYVNADPFGGATHPMTEFEVQRDFELEQPGMPTISFEHPLGSESSRVISAVVEVDSVAALAVRILRHGDVVFERSGIPGHEMALWGESGDTCRAYGDAPPKGSHVEVRLWSLDGVPGEWIDMGKLP